MFEALGVWMSLATLAHGPKSHSPSPMGTWAHGPKSSAPGPRHHAPLGAVGPIPAGTWAPVPWSPRAPSPCHSYGLGL
jgi:hypothetical protein